MTFYGFLFALPVEYLGSSSDSKYIRLISLVSLFCLTRRRTQPASMSLGTKSVLRKRELSKAAACWKASCPCSSDLTYKYQIVNRTYTDLKDKLGEIVKYL